MNQLQKLVAVMAMSVVPNLAFSQAATGTLPPAPTPKAAPAPAPAPAPKAEPKKEEKKESPKLDSSFYYASEDVCVATWRAGKAVVYLPTAQHTKYSDDRIAGLSKRPLEADACMQMETMAGKQWVFQKQGTQVYTRGPNVVYLAECQNDIYAIKYLKKDEPKAAAPAPAPVVASPAPQPAPAPQAVAAPVEAPAIRQRVDVDVNVNVRVNAQQSTATSPVASTGGTATASSDCGSGCHKGFKVDKVVPRTDGRCVIAFRNDRDEYRFVRFETMKVSNILHGAKVDDEKADWNHNYELVPIGARNNGVDQAFYAPNPTCQGNLKAIQTPGVLDRIGKRLGLTKTCRPVRAV